MQRYVLLLPAIIHKSSPDIDIRSFDTPALLHPFLQVIQASATSAPITSLALVAITKFFSYNIISYESPRLSLAMQSLSTAITHCRFEASDSAADDIVLLRILKLMEGMLSGPGGKLLSDESVCEMMETGLSMCCQPRLSEVLRKSAEMSMIKMCQVIFERLKDLEVEAGDVEALDEQTKGDMDAVKMAPSATANNAVVSSLSPPVVSEASAKLSSDLVRPSTSSEAPSANAGNVTVAVEDNAVDVDIKPYSLPSIRELFRVLVDLLDPQSKQQADSMRVMALRIVDVALEVAGPSIAKHPSLALLAEDRLCRHLFQLVRSDNMAILQEALIVAGTLLSTCRGVLKLQQELFLAYMVACLHPRVEIPKEEGIDPKLYAAVPQAPKLVKPLPSQSPSGRSTPVPVKDRQKLGMEGGSRKPDAREAMVESVGTLARIPSFMVELFVNYDCDPDRSDLCEDMIGLLSRNAIPDSATWSTTSVPPLCLDALLGYIQFIDERLDDEPNRDGLPDESLLKERRRKKKIIISGTSKFNESPKAGLAYLASQGIIENLDDPEQVAGFLKSTSRIQKKMLGEFLSKKGNEAILEAFMNRFNFTGKRVDEALRELLEAFRLPGESALIERIIVTFAEKYCEQPVLEEVADKDAVYVLTYAIIMLNTDQHNPNLKSQNRMTLLSFQRNLRGVNAGKDFSPEYLEEIFNSIKSNEIILPDEHDNQHAFDYAWKELLLKTGQSGELVICNTNIYDADMFAATWQPVIATLSYVFISASDDAVFHRVITGFDQCARIATRYGMTDVMDQIVFALSYISTLATPLPADTSLNTEMQVEDTSVMVSELAVKFGRDFKAQLATVVLFRVVSGSERYIKEGWTHLVRIWINLFVNSLITPLFPVASSRLKISPIPLQNPSQVIDRGAKTADSGLFSAFTSYISSYAADDPPEPSEEELESTLCTVGCVNACYIDDVFTNVAELPVETLQALVQALLAQIPEDPSSSIIAVKEDTQTVIANGYKTTSPEGPVYDPAFVYLLELCTILASRDGDTIQAMGLDVSEALQNVLRDAASYHPTVVGRVVYYLFTLLRVSYDYSIIRIPVILHTIASFRNNLIDKTASLILEGLLECLRTAGPLHNEIITSPDFWVILRTLSKNESSSAMVFTILEGVNTGDTPPSVVADNYEPVVSLLNDFASAGSVGAQVEQRHEKKIRRVQTPSKAVKSEPNPTVERGVKAVGVIFQLTSRIPTLMQQSHLESGEAWKAYWSPIFAALTTQCTNPCREIRHQAFSSLQRSLLSQEVNSGSQQPWTAIFDEVLFPLIFRLLKPEVYSTDPAGMGETRLQAANLLCRIFLHYLSLLSEWDGMLALWLKILDIMDRLMSSGQGDSLVCNPSVPSVTSALLTSEQEEAVPESLKNILLVMSTSGYLVPKSEDPNQEKLWSETWKRLDRFLPDLRKQLNLDEEAQVTSRPAAVSVVQEKPQNGGAALAAPPAL